MLSSFNIKKKARFFCTKYSLIYRFFCRSEPLVYIDVLEQTTVSSKSILLLSPNDYWVMRAKLNVKSEKEAANYGAALFDLSNEYRYEAQRIEKDSYILIAYNPTKLSQRLSVSTAIIKKMTFAQWVFNDQTHPIHLPNGKYLTTLDGIVIEIDGLYLNTNTSIELDTALSYPRTFLRTAPIEKLVSYELSSKTLRNTLIILLILLGNLATITVSSYQESLQLSKEIDTLFSLSKIPETSIEREAILDSLKKKEKKQLRIRHVSKEISILPIEGKIITPPSALPSLPPVIPTSSDGVVLIPGSKPGEPNRLIVDNTPSIPAIELHGEGIREFSYDGNGIYIVIDAEDANVRNSLKNTIMNRFKHAQVNEHNTQIEVRLK
ncbi:hypothetical protein [Sulfuricurvum sp.]|uniref:hypothetical protein n=1 Tax=Sulfuricurvum sp. TaxID=2025608 RepID=UPI003BB5975F